MKKLNVGLIGYGFMGRTHSNAFRKVNNFFDLQYQPVLKAVCARSARGAPGARATSTTKRATDRLARTVMKVLAITESSPRCAWPLGWFPRCTASVLEEAAVVAVVSPPLPVVPSLLA